MGTITRSKSSQLHTLIQVKWDLIGFLDRSWRIKQGTLPAGIRGFIQKKNGDSIFSFSKSSRARDALDPEWHIPNFLIRNFLWSKWQQPTNSLLIYMDCSTLVCKFSELFTDGVEEAHLLVRPKKIYIKQIPRDLNLRKKFKWPISGPNLTPSACMRTSIRSSLCNNREKDIGDDGFFGTPNSQARVLWA